jgi:hypothetical protein
MDKMFQLIRDSETSTVDVRVSKLLFWADKVTEWKEDQVNRMEMKQKSQETQIITSRKSSPVKRYSVADPQDSKFADNSSRLLDGTKYHPLPNILTIFEDVAKISAKYSGHLANLVPDGESVVTINTISEELSENYRLRTQEKTKTYLNNLWISVFSGIQKKVDKYKDKLVCDKEKMMCNFESKMANLEETINFRLNRLPQIKASHENEAKFITEYFEECRISYSKRMTAVIADLAKFEANTVDETFKTLPCCRSISDIEQLRIKFQNAVDTFNCGISDEIESNNLQFENSKKMLIKSRTQGYHSSAWSSLKESGILDGNNLTQIMDKFKEAITDHLNKKQKDLMNRIKVVLKEIELYRLDWVFITYRQKLFKKLKIRVNSEVDLSHIDSVL